MGENEDGSDGRNGSGGGKVGDDTGVCVCVCLCVCVCVLMGIFSKMPIRHTLY